MKKLLLPFLIGLLSATHVSAHTSDAETTVDVIAKTTKSWNGNQLPSYLSGTPEITILRITIPPGTSLPLHIHPVINAGVMMQGALTVFTEDEQILHLKAGDPIVEVVDNRISGLQMKNLFIFSEHGECPLHHDTSIDHRMDMERK